MNKERIVKRIAELRAEDEFPNGTRNRALASWLEHAIVQDAASEATYNSMGVLFMGLSYCGYEPAEIKDILIDLVGELYIIAMETKS